jgi:hypothetical protein
LRTLPGSVTTGAAAPVSPFSEVFCAMLCALRFQGCFEAVLESHTRRSRRRNLLYFLSDSPRRPEDRASVAAQQFLPSA